MLKPKVQDSGALVEQADSSAAAQLRGNLVAFRKTHLLPRLWVKLGSALKKRPQHLCFTDEEMGAYDVSRPSV